MKFADNYSYIENYLPLTPQIKRDWAEGTLSYLCHPGVIRRSGSGGAWASGATQTGDGLGRAILPVIWLLQQMSPRLVRQFLQQQ